jgi:protein-tyrosine phosphatase
MQTPQLPEGYQASSLYPYLWIGPKPPFDHPLTGFSTLVLCASEVQPEQLAFGGQVWRVRLEDREEPLTQAHAHDAVRAGRAIARQVESARNVLVTCHAGLNRSALVAGLALVELGYPLSITVGALRNHHAPDALNNQVFYRFLEQHAVKVRQRQQQRA